MRGHRQIKLDANHNDVAKGLRDWGASVASTAAVGGGFVDLVAAYAGRTVLFEVKDPAQPPSKRQLTADEVKFRAGWKGAIYTVLTAEEACEYMRIEVQK